MTWLERTLISLPFHWCLCTTEKQFSKVLKYLKVPEQNCPAFLATEHSDATAHFFENSEGKTTVVVSIRSENVTRAQVNAMLVHEAMHIWREMRERIGEKFPSSEFEAYVVQQLSQTLFIEYDRQTEKQEVIPIKPEEKSNA